LLKVTPPLSYKRSSRGVFSDAFNQHSVAVKYVFCSRVVFMLIVCNEFMRV